MSRKVVVTIMVLALSAGIAAGCGAGPGGGSSGSPDIQAATTAPAGGATAAAATGAGVAVAEASAGLARADSGPSLSFPGPRIVQTASLAVTVRRGAFEDTVAAARTIVSGLGGFVTSSNASQGVGDRLVRGTLVLRVPQPAYARAMTALARLGRVRSREEAGEDVSRQVVDLEARRRHLEAVEAQLLGFLRRTRTVAEALAVQNRLDDVQLALEQARGELRYLDDQTSLATISLSVSERGAPVASPPKDGWGLGDAWRASVRALEKVAGGLFVALVTAGPFLLVLALGLLAGRRLVRRRRTRATAASGTNAPTASPSA